MNPNCPACRSFLKKTYWFFLGCLILGAFTAIVVYAMTSASVEARDNITAMYNKCELERYACQNPGFQWRQSWNASNLTVAR